MAGVKIDPRTGQLVFDPGPRSPFGQVPLGPQPQGPQQPGAPVKPVAGTLGPKLAGSPKEIAAEQRRQREMTQGAVRALRSPDPQMREIGRDFFEPQRRAIAAAQQGGPDFWDRLAMMFAGPDDPNLSPEQNETARRVALVNAGLAMLMASGPSLVPRGLGQILAQGMLVGRQAGAGQREQLSHTARRQAERAEMLQMFRSVQDWNDPAELRHLELVLTYHAAAGSEAAERALRQISSIVRAAEQRQQAALERGHEASMQADRWKHEQALGPDAQQLFGREQALADDFFREAKDAQVIANAWSTAHAAGDNAVGDQTRIIMLVKVNDPTSIVRESEFARVATAGGYGARVQWYMAQLTNQGRLPETIRQQLMEEIDRVARTYQRTFRSTIERYTTRATRASVDPSAVVFDPFADMDRTGQESGSGSDETSELDLFFRGGQ